jgi:hypothetical protein
MIYESHPWRLRLAKDADIIDRWAAKKKVTEHRSFLIEQKLFVAAYAMRKLMEARKLPSSFEDRNFDCKTFSAFGNKTIMPWTAHRFDEFYDLDAPSECKLGIKSLLDLLIHSLVFGELLRGDETVEGFAITSDHKRSNLWFVNLSDFTAIMRRTADDGVSHAVRYWDETVGQWKEWRGNGEPPENFKRYMPNT